MNQNQVSGSLDRAGIALVTWFLTVAAQKGWLSTSDVATLAPAIIVIIAYAYGLWHNRGASIVASASALSGVQQITVNDPSLAQAAKAADPTTQVNLTPAQK